MHILWTTLWTTVGASGTTSGSARLSPVAASRPASLPDLCTTPPRLVTCTKRAAAHHQQDLLLLLVLSVQELCFLSGLGTNDSRCLRRARPAPAAVGGGVPPRGPARECGREGSYGVRPELEHQPVGVSVRRTGRRRASAGVSGPARPRARHRRACDDSRLGRTARLVSSALSNRHSPLAQHHSAATAASQEVCR